MQSLKSQTVHIPVATSPSLSAHDQVAVGDLYGSGENAVILSNMDTNCRYEWEPAVTDLYSTDHMILTYDYPKHEDDQSGVLNAAIAFVKAKGARKIILIGASRGGVASVKVAANPQMDKSIIGISPISTPVAYAGTTFFTPEELSGINIPKLLINSEYDVCADGTRKMYDLFTEPKEMQFYSGDAHGTQLFYQHRQPVIQKLREFITALFSS